MDPACSQRRRTVPSRADTISAYHTQQTEQLQTVEEGPNDTPDADEDQTSQLPSEEADIMPSPNHQPSHARICRTRPEDAGKKFGRGVLKGLKAAKKHYDNGSEKLQIQFSTRLGGPIGVNYQTFVQEVVTFMKKRAPLMHARKWSDIDKSVKRDIVLDTLALWDLADTPETTKRILHIAKERYRGWRSTLHATYKYYKTDAERRRNKPEEVGVEEWDYLIQYFGTDTKFQELSRINSQNRKKQKTKHLMGSKSYSQLSYEKRDKETEEEPDDIQMWELSHLKNGVWSNSESQAVHEDACAQVTEKEIEEGGPTSNEERNTIFQNSCRTALGCGASQSHACGYMAKPHTVSKSLHAQMDEQARATIETQRQNEELTCHVQHLEDKNEELQLQVQDVEEQNKELHAEVKDLENKIETDRTVRAKEIEDLKQSLRDEMLQMIGNQAAATQQPSQDKQYESSSNRTTVKHPLSQDQSSKQIPSARIISSHHLRQTAKSRCRQ
ncbi:hypothetical protein ACP4OV_011830 [Aristida adscensionis]